MDTLKEPLISTTSSTGRSTGVIDFGESDDGHGAGVMDFGSDEDSVGTECFVEIKTETGDVNSSVPIPLTEGYAESTGVTSQSSDQKVSTVDDYGRCDNATATTERTLGAVAATGLVDIRKVLKAMEDAKMPCTVCARKFKTRRGLEAHKRNKQHDVRHISGLREANEVQPGAESSPREDSREEQKSISVEVTRLEHLELAAYEAFYDTNASGESKCLYVGCSYMYQSLGKKLATTEAFRNHYKLIHFNTSCEEEEDK